MGESNYRNLTRARSTTIITASGRNSFTDDAADCIGSKGLFAGVWPPRPEQAILDHRVLVHQGPVRARIRLGKPFLSTTSFFVEPVVYPQPCTVSPRSTTRVEWRRGAWHAKKSTFNKSQRLVWAARCLEAGSQADFYLAATAQTNPCEQQR